MIPPSNAINAHALDVVADDELLLPVLQAFLLRHDDYKPPEMSDFYSLRTVVQMFVAPTNRNSVTLFSQQSPAQRWTCPPIGTDHSYFSTPS